MDAPEELTNDELMLAAKAVGIHRQSMRRKLSRLSPTTTEYASTLQEMADAQTLLTKLNRADLDRLLVS